MNKLSNTVIAFAPLRPSFGSRSAFSPRAALGRAERAGLMCHWRRDPASGRLLCDWSLPAAAAEGEEPYPIRRAG